MNYFFPSLVKTKVQFSQEITTEGNVEIEVVKHQTNITEISQKIVFKGRSLVVCAYHDSEKLKGANKDQVAKEIMAKAIKKVSDLVIALDLGSQETKVGEVCVDDKNQISAKDLCGRSIQKEQIHKPLTERIQDLVKFMSTLTMNTTDNNKKETINQRIQNLRSYLSNSGGTVPPLPAMNPATKESQFALNTITVKSAEKKKTAEEKPALVASDISVAPASECGNHLLGICNELEQLPELNEENGALTTNILTSIYRKFERLLSRNILSPEELKTASEIRFKIVAKIENRIAAATEVDLANQKHLVAKYEIWKQEQTKIFTKAKAALVPDTLESFKAQLASKSQVSRLKSLKDEVFKYTDSYIEMITTLQEWQKTLTSANLSNKTAAELRKILDVKRLELAGFKEKPHLSRNTLLIEQFSDLFHKALNILKTKEVKSRAGICQSLTKFFWGIFGKSKKAETLQPIVMEQEITPSKPVHAEDKHLSITNYLNDERLLNREY